LVYVRLVLIILAFASKICNNQAPAWLLLYQPSWSLVITFFQDTAWFLNFYYLCENNKNIYNN